MIRCSPRRPILRVGTRGLSALVADPSFVEHAGAPTDFDVASAVVYPDFCSQEEHDELVEAKGVIDAAIATEDGQVLGQAVLPADFAI